MAYHIEYADEVEAHLRSLTARERAIVFDAIEKTLVHLPRTITRNCKPMRSNEVAPWVLRVGDLRVYFDSEDEPEPIVTVRAIGRKVRNRIIIDDEEAEL